MSEEQEPIIEEGPSKAKRVQDLLTELNAGLRVVQVFKDGQFLAQEIQVFDKPPAYTEAELSAIEAAAIEAPTGYSE